VVQHSSQQGRRSRVHGVHLDLWHAQVAALSITTAVAALVLLGWTVGPETLRSVHPDWAATRPWVAGGLLAFCVGAAALMAPQTRAARALTVASPFLVLGCVVGLVVRDATGRAYPMLGQDMPDVPGLDGRLSSASVIGLVALAVALACLDRQREAVAQSLGILGAVIGLTGLTSYLYGFRADDTGVFLNSLALPTSVALLAAGLLVALLTSDVGLMALLRSDTAGGLIVRWLLVPVALTPAAAAALVLWLAQEDVLGLRAALAISAALATVGALAGLWLVAARLRDLDEQRAVAESAWEATSRALAANGRASATWEDTP